MNACGEIINEMLGVGAAANKLVWQKLSLYTTAESCTMCMSGCKWVRLGENVFGVSIDQTDSVGWSGIQDHSAQVQHQSNRCSFGDPSHGTSYQTRLIEGVLAEQLLPLFRWQFNATAECPRGCHRTDSQGCIKN